MLKGDPITLTLAIVVSIAAVAIGASNLVAFVNLIHPAPIERDSSTVINS